MTIKHLIGGAVAALLLTFAAPLPAQQTAALQRPVSLELRSVSLHEALKQISKEAGLQLAFSSDALPNRQVSLRLDRVSAVEALQQALGGTRFRLLSTTGGQLALDVTPPVPVRQAPKPTAAVTGVVTGVVTDGDTGAPISGATVTVVGANLGAVTTSRGSYRIGAVPAGEQTVRVQQIGYAEAEKSVTIVDGGVATADFALDVSALPLDKLVVTGTAFEAQVRSMPNPINVLDAQDIEAKQATKLEDVLRGEIPGVMALSGGQRDFVADIYVRGNAGGSEADIIKIYIDNVEVASPTLLSTIDPQNIDRIEVIKGPAAAAIYGSGAASGVLQIFTKDGSTGLARPQLHFEASGGMIESAYTPEDAGTPLTQEYSFGLNGGGEGFSYRAGTTYSSVGEWVNNYSSDALSLSAAVSAAHGPLTAKLTANWSNRDTGWGFSPMFLRFPSDACVPCGNPDFTFNYIWDLTQRTTAITLDYQATNRWQHSLTLGEDHNRAAYDQSGPSLNTPADTFVSLHNEERERRQARYRTAYDAPLGEDFTARLSGGADYWRYDLHGTDASGLLQATGEVVTSPNTSVRLTNDGWWNAGYYGMAEVGYQDRLYLTLAGRIEDNPNLGEEYGLAFVPRLGASYIHELGSAEMKLRAQWGKGVRPPSPIARRGATYGQRIYIGNPAIAPEVKSGWDAGVDLYWGNRASFSITRFDEEAENLIHAEPVDATATPPVYQYRNIGVVGMEGWELEGSLSMGRVTLSANYAYSDTEVKQVDAVTAANPNATLQVGDRTMTAPKHSGGGRLTARVGRGAVSLDASVMSDWRQLDYVAFYGFHFNDEPYRGSFRDYYVEYPALWRFNLRAEQTLADRWSAFMRVENLTDNQDADYYNINVAPGRTTVLGVRWSM